MAYFDTAIIYLDSWGLTDAILPFILIFTVLFAILMKVEIFTEKKDGKPVASRRYNSIIALAIALLVVIPHVTRSYAADADPITIINTFLPGAVVITVVLLLFLMISGFVGGGTEAKNSGLVALAGILALLALGFVFWKALYPYTGPTWLYWLDDWQLQSVVVAILLMGLVVWYIVKDDTPEKKPTSMPEVLKEWFK